MTKKVGVGKAHSKIILMGEHSVVYGHPALALPLKDIEVVCQIQATETPLTLKAQDPLTTAIFSALNYLKISLSVMIFRLVSLKSVVWGHLLQWPLRLFVRFLIISTRNLARRPWKCWSIRQRLLPIVNLVA